MAKSANPKGRNLLRGSLETAFERNKNESKILNVKKQFLDFTLQKNIAKLQREETLLSQQYIYSLKKEKAKHHDQEEKIRPVNEKRKQISKYFELINLKKIDKSNSLLPSLVKSLNEQRLNSYRNILDIAQRQNIKLVRKDVNNQFHFQNNSDSCMNKNDSDLNVPSYSNFSVDSQYLPNLSKSVNKNGRMVDERAKSSKYDINRFDLKEVKSIRRGRLSAKQINETYDSKVNVLKIFRQYNLEGSSNCSKLCKYKHLSAF
jgi:hypothetical protein